MLKRHCLPDARYRKRHKEYCCFIGRVIKRFKIRPGYWWDILLSGGDESLPISPECFIDNNRAILYKLITVKNRDVCVDIAASSGAIAASLAQEYKSVYALESVDNWLEFMNLRFGQDNTNNVKVLKALLPILPIENESVDLIIAHDVLREGSRIASERNPRRALLNILSEAQSCLKRGGKIAAAVRNGLSIASFFEGTERRSCAYSYWQYVELFKKAGFKNIKTYLSYPEHDSPRQVYSMDKPSLADFYNMYHARSKLCKMVKKLSDLFNMRYMLAFYEKSYYIVGQK